MKPHQTFAMIAAIVIAGIPAGAAHAIGEPPGPLSKPAMLGGCTSSPFMEEGFVYYGHGGRVQAVGGGLWIRNLEDPTLSAWTGNGYQFISSSPYGHQPYFAPAGNPNGPFLALSDSHPPQPTLPPCNAPPVPTGYIKVTNTKGVKDLFYLNQAMGAASDLFVSPATGWGVDERGVYFQGILKVGREQFCKLVDGICLGQLDAATITATAQSIALQVLQARYEVVHVLGHHIWVGDAPAAADPRDITASNRFAYAVNQRYRKPSSAAVSAMGGNSGRIVFNPQSKSYMMWRAFDNQSYHMGDEGLYYQDRLIEPKEKGRNIPAITWRLLSASEQPHPTPLNEGIATTANVYVYGNAGKPVEGVDANSFKPIGFGYGFDANRFFYGTKPLQGVPSNATTRTPLLAKRIDGVNFSVMYLATNPKLVWIAGVPHTLTGEVTWLSRPHGVQNMLTDGAFVYDAQGLRYAAADVVPYVCDSLQLRANPPNAYIKAIRAGAEPAFYSLQGQRITHRLDLAAIVAAKCQRND